MILVIIQNIWSNYIALYLLNKTQSSEGLPVGIRAIIRTNTVCVLLLLLLLLLFFGFFFFFFFFFFFLVFFSSFFSIANGWRFKQATRPILGIPVSLALREDIK